MECRSIISCTEQSFEMVQSMDTDNSGTITADELREAMKKQGSPLVQEELQRLLESIDVDATGRLAAAHSSKKLVDFRIDMQRRSLEDLTSSLESLLQTI